MADPADSIAADGCPQEVPAEPPSTAAPAARPAPPRPTGTLADWIDVQAPMQKLDEGVYGTVFLAHDKHTKEKYAVKKMKITEDEGGVPSTAVREIGLLRELDHENVVRFVGVELQGSSRLFIIMEYLERNLDEVIKDRHRQRLGGLAEAEATSVAHQLLNGLQYCHTRKVIHRDIKPANILVSAGGVLKLCDFGISRSCLYPNSNGMRLTRDVVTLWYRSPEILLGSDAYGGGADVWSVGCVVAESLTLCPLFRGDCEFGQLVQIFETRGTPNDDVWPEVSAMPFYNPLFPQWRPLALGGVLGLPEESLLVELLYTLLFLDPARRITAKQAVRHPLFSAGVVPLHLPARPVRQGTSGYTTGTAPTTTAAAAATTNNSNGAAAHAQEPPRPAKPAPPAAAAPRAPLQECREHTRAPHAHAAAGVARGGSEGAEAVRAQWV